MRCLSGGGVTSCSDDDDDGGGVAFAADTKVVTTDELGAAAENATVSPDGIITVTVVDGALQIVSVASGKATITATKTNYTAATVPVTVANTGAITVGDITKFVAQNPENPPAQAVTLTGIEITTQPTTVAYVKESAQPDFAGLVVSKTYSNGNKTVLSASDYDISGWDSAAANPSLTITVTAKDSATADDAKASGFTNTATFTVQITETAGEAQNANEQAAQDAATVVSIEVAVSGTAAFDTESTLSDVKAALTVTPVMKNGDRGTALSASDYTISLKADALTTAGAKEFTVTYTEKNVISDTVTIVVSEKQAPPDPDPNPNPDPDPVTSVTVTETTVQGTYTVTGGDLKDGEDITVVLVDEKIYLYIAEAEAYAEVGAYQIANDVVTGSITLDSDGAKDFTATTSAENGTVTGITIGADAVSYTLGGRTESTTHEPAYEEPQESDYAFTMTLDLIEVKAWNGIPARTGDKKTNVAARVTRTEGSNAGYLGRKFWVVDGTYAEYTDGANGLGYTDTAADARDEHTVAAFCKGIESEAIQGPFKLTVKTNSNANRIFKIYISADKSALWTSEPVVSEALNANESTHTYEYEGTDIVYIGFGTQSAAETSNSKTINKVYTSVSSIKLESDTEIPADTDAALVVTAPNTTDISLALADGTYTVTIPETISVGSIAWYVDGTKQENATENTFAKPASGNYVLVVVTATDGTVYSQQLTIAQ